MGMFDSTLQRLADICKRDHDQSIGWSFEDAKMLRLEINGRKSEELYAEIHREPVMGFSPKGERVTVRITRHIVHDALPADGISLYDGERPFGEEKGWKLNQERMFMDEWHEVHYFLEDA